MGLKSTPLKGHKDDPDPCPAYSLVATEIVEWDEQIAGGIFECSWPTYRRRFIPLTRGHQHFGSVAGMLGSLGYHIVSVTYSRCGFLWLKKARLVIFQRDVALNGGYHFRGRDTKRVREALVEMNESMPELEDYY